MNVDDEQVFVCTIDETDVKMEDLDDTKDDDVDFFREEYTDEIRENEDEDIGRNIVLPPKSKQRYEAMFEAFEKWQNSNGCGDSFSEDKLMTYFRELSVKKSPSTLWSAYSMLKATIKMKFNIDIGKYSRLIKFLKDSSKGYNPVTAKVFTSEEIAKFIDEAPDEVYLVTKVVLIFGLMGACKTDELVNMRTDHIQTHDKLFLIKIPKTSSTVARTFTISDQYFDIVNKYKQLRPASEKSTRFFLKYSQGKCCCQPIGKNKFAKMPQQIAEYLNLKDPQRYTGHSFRRTSTTLLASSGVNLLRVKRQRAWKSTTVAEGYINDDLHHEPKTDNLKERLNLSSSVEYSNLSNLEFEIDSDSVIEEIGEDKDNVIKKRVDFINRHFSFHNCSNVTINFK